MASNTPNLDLYKKDPIADASDTFNITTMLNENWDKIDEGFGELDDTVASHTSNKSNPHGVTKSQVGLGSVQNYGIATQEEAEAGSSTTKYMTPQRTKQAIDKFAPVKSVAGKTGNVTLTGTDIPQATTSARGSVQLNDTLTSTSTTQALTANQGKVLKDLVDGKASSIDLEMLDTKVDEHLAETTSKFTSLNVNMIDMAVELETVKGATLNGVTANIFIETFQNLDDIILMNGVYDSINKRLVL